MVIRSWDCPRSSHWRRYSPSTPLLPVFDDAVLEGLMQELPNYLAAITDVSLETAEEKLQRWSHQHGLPCWSNAMQKLLLVQPSSAACERVFSLLSTTSSPATFAWVQGQGTGLTDALGAVGCYIYIDRRCKRKTEVHIRFDQGKRKRRAASKEKKSASGYVYVSFIALLAMSLLSKSLVRKII